MFNGVSGFNGSVVEELPQSVVAKSGKSRRWLSRRSALKSLFAAGCAALGWSVAVEPFWLELSKQQLTLPNLPTQWIGKRLVHISDLHVGRTNHQHLLNAMQRVNELKPDVLAITGDFVDKDFPVDKRLDEVLKVLTPAQVATVACLGNHDFGEDWSKLSVADQVTDALHRFGIRILRNETEDIDGIDFLGLEDYWSPLFAPSPVLSLANPERASICLCHNPDAYDAADWSLFRGLILSGHTHGGQCKPPFFRPPLLPVENDRYVSGFVDLSMGQQMYISRGVGYSLRARFNCRPEITIFEMA